MATVTIPASSEVEIPRTPEQIEREWFEKVYQGDHVKQLTARAIIMGMLLGMIMACSNVYIGLKAGWSMGVTITSAVLAFTIFQAISGTIGPLLVKAHGLPLVGPFFKWLWPENHYSILENNCLQSTARAIIMGMLLGMIMACAVSCLTWSPW